jgi:hypothetical protein
MLIMVSAWWQDELASRLVTIGDQGLVTFVYRA